MLCALLFATGCSKEQQAELNLEAELLMQYNSIAFTIEPTESTGEVQLTLSLDGNALSDMLAANGYTMGQLKEFKFTNANVRMQGDSMGYYDALQRLSVELSLDSGTSAVVASIDPVPDGATVLNLAVNEVNIADIMRHSDISVTVKLTTDQAVSDTLHQLLGLGGKVVVQL